MALDPETPWRSVSICRGGKSGEPATVIELEPLLGGALGGMRARQALEVVAHCYRSGMREPLPLFPTFSKSVADGAVRATAWHHREGWADADKGATAFFFGHLTTQEVLALPAEEWDPDGSGGRVARWAALLWGEVASTVGPVPA